MVPAPFNKIVNDCEELRDALDLIDDDRGSGGRGLNEFAQALGTGLQFAMNLGAEEVDQKGIRHRLTDECGLACSAGPEEEEVPIRRREESTYYRHNGPQYGASVA